jgi:hypothetical protein
MAGADKPVPSRVNETSVDRVPRLRKSDKVVGTARSLKHMFTGQGSETVALVKRGRGAPPKDSDEQSPERRQVKPVAAQDVGGHAAAPPELLPNAAAQDTQQQPKEKRLCFNAAAVFRQHVEAAPMAANKQGKMVARVKCTICGITMFDNIDTVTKHVGWITDDKDTREGHFDTPANNVHQRKLQAKVEGIIMQEGVHRRQTAAQVRGDIQRWKITVRA